MQNQKCAIVTGASRGIGKVCALGLAKLGYHCILIARNRGQLEGLAEEIYEEGGEASLFAVDLSDEQEIISCTEKIKKHYPEIEVMVNNAGIYFDGSLELNTEDFRKQIELNLTANYILLKELVPVMKRQKSGHIFNIASRAGKIGFEGGGAYSASKFALVGLSESLYRGLAKDNVRVTSICPGWVNTEMAQVAGTPWTNEDMIQPEDILKTIEYLLSLSSGACIKEMVIETPKSIV